MSFSWHRVWIVTQSHISLYSYSLSLIYFLLLRDSQLHLFIWKKNKQNNEDGYCHHIFHVLSFFFCWGIFFVVVLFFQQLQKLKAENEKLKAENRALTRVVSKLTANAALASTSSSSSNSSSSYYSPSANSANSSSSSSYIGGK